MLAELKLQLPKDCRISDMAFAIWGAGVTPWSWAWQCGPDFLPRFTAEQHVGWAAYAMAEKIQHVRAAGLTEGEP